VLSWIGAHASPRTSIVFDAIWASVLGGESDLYGARELLATVDAVAEPLRWGIPDGKADETLERFGLRAERILDDEYAIARYLTRTDGSVLGRPSVRRAPTRPGRDKARNVSADERETLGCRQGGRAAAGTDRVF